jgi:hypothetical protein
MTATGTQPWYWTVDGGEHDHWAVGLVLCMGDNGRVHYVRAGRHGMVPACGRHIDGLRVLEVLRLVECRICCAVARADRDRIEQRHVQNIIKSQDRVNFIRRDQVRKREAWLTRSGR